MNFENQKREEVKHLIFMILKRQMRRHY